MLIDDDPHSRMERDLDVLAQRAAGVPIRALAERYHLTCAGMRTLLTHAERRYIVRELHAGGLTQAEVACHLGASPQAVGRMAAYAIPGYVRWGVVRTNVGC